MPVRVWEGGELVYDARPRQPGEPKAAYARRVARSTEYATKKLRWGTHDAIVYAVTPEKILR